MCGYQCSLRACKKADSPSITSRIPMVRTAQNAHRQKMMAQPTSWTLIAILKPYIVNTMFHSTSESSVQREREGGRGKKGGGGEEDGRVRECVRKEQRTDLHEPGRGPRA